MNQDDIDDVAGMTKEEVITGIMELGKRAAILGLLPAKGAKISNRGEFIIDETNIEEDENKKMRGMRFIEFPKTLHAWPEDHEEPLSLSVKNRAEEQAALAVGWQEMPLHGPAGRLDAAGTVAEPEPEPEVREFAAPGQPQPFEAKAQTGTKAKTEKAPRVIAAPGEKAKKAKKAK